MSPSSLLEKSASVIDSSSCTETERTVVSDPATEPVSSYSRRRATAKIRFQCSRCLKTIEIDSIPPGGRLRCNQCSRSLRIPKIVRQVCPHCGCHGEYSPDASGNRIRCQQCGMRILIPVQVAKSRKKHHRRHARSKRSIPHETSLLPLFVSLCVSLIGVILCYRVLSNL